MAGTKYNFSIKKRGNLNMTRIVTIETRDLDKSAKEGGCGECQTSCQSACKTSCGVANQACEKLSK
jgi:predicted ribosomally synthesized six-cysteine peptide SCIFF